MKIFLEDVGGIKNKRKYEINCKFFFNVQSHLGVQTGVVYVTYYLKVRNQKVEK